MSSVASSSVSNGRQLCGGVAVIDVARCRAAVRAVFFAILLWPVASLADEPEDLGRRYLAAVLIGDVAEATSLLAPREAPHFSAEHTPKRLYLTLAQLYKDQIAFELTGKTAGADSVELTFSVRVPDPLFAQLAALGALVASVARGDRPEISYVHEIQVVHVMLGQPMRVWLGHELTEALRLKEGDVRMAAAEAACAAAPSTAQEFCDSRLRSYRDAASLKIVDQNFAQRKGSEFIDIAGTIGNEGDVSLTDISLRVRLYDEADVLLTDSLHTAWQPSRDMAPTTVPAKGKAAFRILIELDGGAPAVARAEVTPEKSGRL